MNLRWIHHLLHHKRPRLFAVSRDWLAGAGQRVGELARTAANTHTELVKSLVIGTGALLAIGLLAAIWISASDAHDHRSTPVTAPTHSTSAATPVPAPRGKQPPPRTPPTPVPAPTVAPGSYTVVRGDTLASIALRVRVPFEQIAKANEIVNPNKITVGQKLTIGFRPIGVEVIDRGATIAGLAPRFGVSTKTLVTLNPHVLKPPGLLAGGGIRIRAVTR